MSDDYNNVSEFFRVKVGATEDDAKNAAAYKNFFSLHYSSNRVNFHYHQRKTLALAKQIAGDEKESNKQIVVLGGGIGGVTCFLALRGLGMKQVHLIEAGPSLLGVQAGCHHRHGHPTAIDWPRVPCAMTTDLPVMNWGGGSADAIRRQMLAGEDRTVLSPSTYEARVLREWIGEYVHLNTVVKKIIPQGDGEWKLDFDPSPDVDLRRPDIVIYALGFGQDRHVDWSRAESYWWEDNLENYIRDRHVYGSKKFVVTGRGDGAMIDFARLALGQGAGKDPIPEMLGSLREEKYHTPPMVPDFDDDEHALWHDCFKKLEKHSDAADVQNWAKNAGDHLPAFENFRVKLGSRIKDVHTKTAKIELIGRMNTDRKIEGSKANWLLHQTLLSLGDGRLEDLNGEVAETLEIKKSADKGGKEIDMTEKVVRVSYQDAEGNLKDEKFGVNEHLVFIRHGPTHKEYLLGLLSDKNERPLKTHELELATENNFGAGESIRSGSRRDYLLNLGFHARNLPESAEVVAWDYRQALTENYLRNVLKIEEVMVCVGRDDKKRMYLEIRAPIVPSDRDTQIGDNGQCVALRNRKKVLDAGGFDRVLFGGAVCWKHRETGRAEFTATTALTLDDLGV